MQVLLRRVRLVLPPASVVQLHPVIFAIFDFPGILQCLGEQVSQVVIVRGVFKPEVAHVGQIFIELLCRETSVTEDAGLGVGGMVARDQSYRDTLRTDP